MTEFDAAIWGITYGLVYGNDDFLKLYRALLITDGQSPEQANRYISRYLTRGQFLHAQEIAKEIRESCQRVNDPDDIRPAGLYYFWKRIQEIYDTDW